MIDRKIVKFFKKHHVLTVATSVYNVPWCANCFYAYIEEENALVFTTEDDTRHGREFILNPVVSGSVVLETMVTGKIRGIQFSGTASKPSGSMFEIARKNYLRRFPVARFMDIHLWIVRLNYIKMTDNRLGFGKKLIWRDGN